MSYDRPASETRHPTHNQAGESRPLAFVPEPIDELKEVEVNASTIRPVESGIRIVPKLMAETERPD
jgi:hypothetical protein